MERQCSWIEIINVVKSNVIYQFNRIPNTILTQHFLLQIETKLF